jgi:hypothetical protein
LLLLRSKRAEHGLLIGQGQKTRTVVGWKILRLKSRHRSVVLRRSRRLTRLRFGRSGLISTARIADGHLPRFGNGLLLLLLLLLLLKSRRRRLFELGSWWDRRFDRLGLVLRLLALGPLQRDHLGRRGGGGGGRGRRGHGRGLVFVLIGRGGRVQVRIGGRRHRRLLRRTLIGRSGRDGTFRRSVVVRTRNVVVMVVSILISPLTMSGIGVLIVGSVVAEVANITIASVAALKDTWVEVAIAFGSVRILDGAANEAVASELSFVGSSTVKVPRKKVSLLGKVPSEALLIRFWLRGTGLAVPEVISVLKRPSVAAGRRLPAPVLILVLWPIVELAPVAIGETRTAVMIGKCGTAGRTLAFGKLVARSLEALAWPPAVLISLARTLVSLKALATTLATLKTGAWSLEFGKAWAWTKTIGKARTRTKTIGKGRAWSFWHPWTILESFAEAGTLMIGESGRTMPVLKAWMVREARTFRESWA